MQRITIRRTRAKPGSIKQYAGLAGGGAGIGIALMFFFDPQSGRRRRHVLADRFTAFFRRRWRRAARAGRVAGSYGYGLTQRASHVREQPKPDMDDVTLTRKLETALFRDADIPKGQINVNVEDRVAYLRGEVGTPELLDQLEKKARKVKGVRDVENLLHLPGQPAPTHV